MPDHAKGIVKFWEEIIFICLFDLQFSLFSVDIPLALSNVSPPTQYKNVTLVYMYYVILCSMDYLLNIMSQICQPCRV